ncbi:MAG: ATP phosphoribosyltransferase [Myxococcota bacterium]
MNDTLRVALPKGRMQDGVLSLLGEAGVQVSSTARSYRPVVNMPGWDIKVLKPQNILEMLHLGSRDVGFAGHDWVHELGLDEQDGLIELLDTGLDPVRVVAAAPTAIVEEGVLPARKLVIASEYQRVTKRWIAQRGHDDIFVRTYGATEVFPPEDADCIVDNTATGATLRSNGLVIVDELMRSSTRLFANARSMDHPAKRKQVEELVLLMESVLAARSRVMVEVNCQPENLDAIIDVLPCMRQPTIAQLHREAGYAVKAAVPRDQLPGVVIALKEAGGTDVVVSRIAQIVS